jgi:putative acetyltransferase
MRVDAAAARDSPTGCLDALQRNCTCDDRRVLLRREVRQDESTTRVVHSCAFGGGGGDDVIETRLLDNLRVDGDIIPELSIVATFNGDIVGHVACSRASLEGRPSVGLGPLGVLPIHQRRGVGQALMHAVLGAADALHEPAVMLLGDPDFYRRFGFVLAAPLGVLPPVSAWTPYFQVRPLHAWDKSRGTFLYAPAFDRI